MTANFHFSYGCDLAGAPPIRCFLLRGLDVYLNTGLYEDRSLSMLAGSRQRAHKWLPFLEH